MKDGQTYSKTNITTALLVLSFIAICGYKWFEILGLSQDQFLYYFKQHSTSLLIAILPFPFIVLLSRLFPADPNSPLLHGGMIVDALYLIIRLLLMVSVFVLLREFMGIAHIKYFDSYSVSLPASTPVVIRVALVFLIADFLFYWYHRLMHGFELLWNFHAIHHSQTNINYFTDARAHVFDRLIAILFLTTPALFLNLAAPQVLLIAILIEYHQKINHSNLKTNYGLLRYVLVNPQSHRIHHSDRPEHQDKNFGASFSIWDFAFGTQYKGFDEYPQTGVEDPAFPKDNPTSILGIIDTFGAHFLYPFSKGYQLLRKQNS